MRTALNELGYHVTKRGTVVYKKRSRPFTLKRIISIFERSFLPWWSESGSGERMDATGFFSASRTSPTDLTKNFTNFVEAASKMSSKFAEISMYFFDTGPGIAENVQLNKAGLVSTIKSLIKIWDLFLKLLERS